MTASRRLVLVVLAIGLVGAGTVATDAGVLRVGDDLQPRDERPDRDELEELENGIVAEPHDGPNGAYAYLDGDGELVIDLTVDNDALEGDGVAAAAVTGISDVFTLTNAGDDAAKIWLEHDADTVTFRTGDRDPIEGNDNAAVLEPNESIHVGFVVDARDLEPGEAVIESLRFRTATLENDREDDGDRDSSSSADSETDTGTGSEPPTASPMPSIEVVEPAPTTRTVTATDVRGQTVTVDLGSLRIGERVALEAVTVRFADVDRADFAVRATPDHKKGEDRSHPRVTDDGSSLGTVTVEDAPSPDAIESVEYRFTVERAVLDAVDEPDSIAFYRSQNGTWERHALERIATDEIAGGTDEGDAAGAVRYAVTIDALSSGVVGGSGVDASVGESDRGVDGDSGGSPDAADGNDTGETDDVTDAPDSADGSGSLWPVGIVGALVIAVCWYRGIRR